VKSDVTRQIK